VPYLTPNAGGGYITRPLRIPLPLLAIVSGHLSYLADYYSWELFGDMSVDDCTMAMQSMIDGYYSGVAMPIGAVTMYAGDTNVLPDNVLLCDGSIHDRVDYPSLYAVLASAYIDDADTFHTPDMVDMFPLGASSNAGSTGGEAYHTLTVDELPSHSHAISNGFGPNVALSAVLGAIEGLSPIPTGETTTAIGGGQAHNNMPPNHAIAFVIICQ